MGDKLYNHRQDEATIDSPAYFHHVSAMTGEDLRRKSEIAAELAARDNRIAELEAGYRQAIEDIADWADYANYYLTGRDEFDCSIEAHRKTLEGE